MRFDYITKLTKKDLIKEILILEDELSSKGVLKEKKRKKLSKMKIELSNRQTKLPSARLVSG